MKTFKHHLYFEKPDGGQRHLFPYVCFDCRKVFRKPARAIPRTCPQCGSAMVMLNRKFSTPKMTDVEQWKKIHFLVEQGFRFQSIHKADGSLVRYPRSMAEAKDFAAQHAHRLRR